MCEECGFEHSEDNDRLSIKEESREIKRENYGQAEFTVKCEPRYVELVIHGYHVVAKSNEDVYEEIFDFVVKKLGGRIDGLK